MSLYPEHDKLEKVQDKSQVCGEFLEWLRTHKHLSLGHWIDEQTVFGNESVFAPAYTNTNKLLGEFFDIDLKKIEEEKEQMLERIRAKHVESN